MEIYIGENVLSAICAQIMLSAQGAELKEFNGLRRAEPYPTPSRANRKGGRSRPELWVETAPCGGA